jgi:hypothetical protein
MDFDSAFRCLFSCDLLGDLGGGVFAVIVDYDYGKFAGIGLPEEAGYGLADSCGFISGRHDGGDSWPRAWGLLFCKIVVEFADAPEHASE